MDINDKKYSVFVSSTFLDLKEEREAVRDAILQMGCIPEGMELFPAMNAPQWNHIQKEIEKADYYVLIIGGRYGSLDPGTGLSYTHREYRYAKELKKHILCFVLDSVSPKYIEDSNGNHAQRGREAFLEELQGNLYCIWKDKTELVRDVIISLFKAVLENKEQGWVRDGELILGNTTIIRTKSTATIEETPSWKHLLNYQLIDSKTELELLYLDVVEGLDNEDKKLDSTEVAAIAYTLVALSNDGLYELTSEIIEKLSSAFCRMLMQVSCKEDLYNVGLNFHRTINWLQGERSIGGALQKLIDDFDLQYADAIGTIRSRMTIALEEISDEGVMEPIKLLNEAIYDHSVTYEMADVFNEVNVKKVVVSVLNLQPSSVHKFTRFFIERYKLRFYMENGHQTYRHLVEVANLKSFKQELKKKVNILDGLHKVAISRLIKVVELSIKRAAGNTTQLMEYNE